MRITKEVLKNLVEFQEPHFFIPKSPIEKEVLESFKAYLRERFGSDTYFCPAQRIVSQIDEFIQENYCLVASIAEGKHITSLSYNFRSKRDKLLTCRNIRLLPASFRLDYQAELLSKIEI